MHTFKSVIIWYPVETVGCAKISGYILSYVAGIFTLQLENNRLCNFVEMHLHGRDEGKVIQIKNTERLRNS